jgi:hypothetical protein
MNPVSRILLSRMVLFILISSTTLVLTGCSSFPEVKTQAYAQLKTEEVFESDFARVWKAIETAIQPAKVLERSPTEVSPSELKKLDLRELKTDWIYSQSRNKYQEYVVNHLPRKIYLQSRYTLRIRAEKTFGGVHVSIETQEQVQRYKSDGSLDSFASIGAPDSSRSSEMLNKIKFTLLSLPSL